MKSFLGCVAFVLAQAPLTAQDHVARDRHEMHRLHQDPKAYIAMLEDPKRDAYQKPHEVLTALKLKRGEVIADIGAGSGYFTFRLARHIGDKGRVYAVDISPEMIVHLNRRIRDFKLKNVVTILAAPDDPLLPEASINRFIICDTWHHVENRTHYLGLLRKMLKRGGEVVMIDFKKEKTPVGPPLEMRIDRGDLVREMEANGFRLAAEQTFLPYQYFLVFKLK
ncbi:MAG: methyltransferase domain-containing protein [Verrucomicrobia bacterium]|nr:methyltransferase domain-containing protein [Verrucomicrobiota bacterium]